jgi:hypothetical protein
MKSAEQDFNAGAPRMPDIVPKVRHFSLRFNSSSNPMTRSLPFDW